MEFMDVIKRRKSTRSYSPADIEDDKIERILHCARLSPSWENKQCWHFIVIKEKKTLNALSRATFINRWIKNVPVLIVACGNPKNSGNRAGMDYFLVDVAIALEHLVLAATDMGLGTCWIGSFNEQRIKNILGIPQNIRVIALTPVGYPANVTTFKEKAVKKIIASDQRKDLAKITHNEKW
jgi:nitroreductase